MRITFDSVKRDRTLAERGLDFADAVFVFSGVTLEIEDTRKDYGEPHIICLACWKGGWLSWVIRRVARIATSSA